MPRAHFTWNNADLEKSMEVSAPRNELGKVTALPPARSKRGLSMQIKVKWISGLVVKGDDGGEPVKGSLDVNRREQSFWRKSRC